MDEASTLELVLMQKKMYADLVRWPPPTAFWVPPRRPEIINGEMGMSFIDMEREKIAEDLKFALVLKFVVHRPPIKTLRQHILRSWGFMEKPTISFMDKQHVLLHLK